MVREGKINLYGRADNEGDFICIDVCVRVRNANQDFIEIRGDHRGLNEWQLDFFSRPLSRVKFNFSGFSFCCLSR